VSAKLEPRSLRIPDDTSSPEGALTAVHHRGPWVVKREKCEGLSVNVSEMRE
jgi:hypothetical protein